MTLRSPAPRRARSLHRRLALGALLLLAGCGGQIEGEDGALVGKLVVSPQLTLEVVNQVYVPVVELNRPGWVVIHDDIDGTPGTLLGQTWFGQEVHLNLEVELSRGVEDGETLHAVLHVDRGAEQVFEPERDDVVEDDSGPIDRTFTVYVDVDNITPTLLVADQSLHPIDDDLDEVEIDEVAVRVSAWVVVYGDAAFTSVLGQTSLRPGISRSVDVRLGRDVNDGETLHVRLHDEAQDAATFDAAVDPPMLVDGAELSGSFVVTIEDVEYTPELQIDDQTAAPGNHVIVQRAVSRGPGLVVVYADDGAGGLGEALGHVALSNGENTGIDVTLGREALDQERLIGRLHEDVDSNGSFDAATDTPMQRDGNEVSDDFIVTVDANLMPGVEVAGIASLSELSTVLTVPSATSIGPGWLVIHADDGAGAPGSVLGQAPLEAGLTSGVTVMLGRPISDGEALHAMLHEDTGTVGTWEPGTDAPATDGSGSPIVAGFSASVPAATPAVRITVGASGSGDFEITQFFPPTVPSPLVGGGGADPELSLTTGWRYELVNDASANHPFEFVQSGASAPADDVVQLSQIATGALESDPDIAWVENGNAVVFTAAPSFTGGVDTYRCQAHPSAMRGSVTAL